jgi:hypothetical protein
MPDFFSNPLILAVASAVAGVVATALVSSLFSRGKNAEIQKQIQIMEQRLALARTETTRQFLQPFIDELVDILLVSNLALPPGEVHADRLESRWNKVMKRYEFGFERWDRGGEKLENSQLVWKVDEYLEVLSAYDKGSGTRDAAEAKRKEAVAAVNQWVTSCFDFEG